jgi:hypothetical protein
LDNIWAGDDGVAQWNKRNETSAMKQAWFARVMYLQVLFLIKEKWNKKVIQQTNKWRIKIKDKVLF